MTTALSSALLLETTTSILEDAAFFFSQPMGAPLPWPVRVLEARLAFSGPTAGTVRIVTTAQFGAELAANLLGIEPTDPEAPAQAKAAVGELLNIICGALVAEWFGTAHICQLGIPEVRELDPARRSAVAACAIALIADERHRVEVDVTLDPSA